MKKRLTALTAALVILFLFQACALADAEYAITNYAMTVDILPDGSAHVTENLIYEFDGDYNGILSLFDTDGIGGIEDFRVYADGTEVLPVDEMQYVDNTYTAETDGSLTQIRVYSPGRDDARLFTYEYTMLDLARRYEDAGTILRSFIGSNSAVTLQNAVVTIRFPESCDIEAYVHGAMDASHITLSENAATFGPKNVSPGDSVEMRLLFPASLIADAPLSGGGVVQAVRAEETERLAEEARRLTRIRYLKYAYVLLYALIFPSACLAMARKYGMYGRLSSQGDPERLAGIPAAFSTAALEGAADTDALSGTLIELAQAGLIRMEPEGDDLRFTLTDARSDALLPHQQAVVNWLFAEGDTFLLSSLHAGGSYEAARHFEERYNSYQTAVNHDMIVQGYKHRNEGLRIFLNALIILLGLAGAGFILLVETNLMLGIALLALMACLLVLMSRVRLLTDSGETIRLDAEALRRQSAPESIRLPLLPHYAALALTEPLVARAKADMQEDADGTPYLYAGWYFSMHRLSSSIRSAHMHNASVPDPNASSSSGGSSGSNGSGGGHGAW